MMVQHSVTAKRALGSMRFGLFPAANLLGVLTILIVGCALALNRNDSSQQSITGPAIASASESTAAETVVAAVPPAPTAPAPSASESILSRAKDDPSVLWETGRARYLEHVRSYKCTLTKQELLADGLTPVQEIEVRYQSSPEKV